MPGPLFAVVIVAVVPIVVWGTRVRRACWGFGFLVRAGILDSLFVDLFVVDRLALVSIYEVVCAIGMDVVVVNFLLFLGWHVLICMGCNWSWVFHHYRRLWPCVISLNSGLKERFLAYFVSIYEVISIQKVYKFLSPIRIPSMFDKDPFSLH